MQRIYDIRDFGAVAGGEVKNTLAIQAAIDACHENGGGQVLISGGRYMSGTVILKSNVELHLATDGILYGSPDCADYPERPDVKHVDSKLLPRWRNGCFIFAEESENISITGLGTIDCHGEAFVTDESFCGWKHKRIDAPTPPRVIFFTGCRNVHFEGFTMTNQPAGWSFWIHDCDYVALDKLKILADVEYPNNDGIHINCSRNVTVSNCDITCGDDCIVVRANSRSLKENKISEKVTVTNCNLTSYASGVRIGWMNCGTIRNCAFSNLVMTDCSVGINFMFPYIPFDPAKTNTADTGRENSRVENISFSNIIMHQVYSNPVRLWIAPEADVKIDTVRNLYFSGIHASSPQHIHLEGRPENQPENIVFTDCDFEITDGSEFPDKEVHGSESNPGGETHMPTVKHVKGITFNQVRLTVK